MYYTTNRRSGQRKRLESVYKMCAGRLIFHSQQTRHQKVCRIFKKGLLFARRYDIIIKLIAAQTEYGRLAQLVEHLLDVQEVTGSSPVPSTIQFVLEPDSLRERVRVRFLFIGGSAEGLLGTVNEQRQGITMIVVSCLLLCGIKFALCELGRPPIWRVWE